MNRFKKLRSAGFISGLSLALIFPYFGAFAANSTRPIRFLLPQSPFSPESDKELTLLIENYNKLHPQGSVELIRRGENFSSMKELITLNLAGDPPEIAAIESSEFPALEPLHLAQPIRLQGFKTSKTLLPFQLTLPVVIADQEMLFRGHANPHRLPERWKDLTLLAQSLADQLKITPFQSLALPLQGPMGLWFLEAILGKRLWSTPPFRNDPSLAQVIPDLQKLIDHPRLARPDESWESALQLFLDRKVPLLISSLDLLPYISRQSTFRWTAGPLPTLTGSTSSLQNGSALIVTQDRPEVRQFLEYLYQPENAILWTARGSYLPLDPEWLKNPRWKEIAQLQPAYVRIVTQAMRPRSSPLSSRASGAQVIRVRSEWTQALRLLFTEASRRLPTHRVLEQMEERLKAKSP